jgi:hypothetical protein
MISCESKKQATVALSTMRAEYMVLYQGTKEAIWLQRLFTDIQGTVITMMEQGAIGLTFNFPLPMKNPLD